MPDMSELDDALDQLNEVQAEVDDDDFDPRSGTPPPSAKTINSMAQDIYDALPKDDEGMAASTTFFDDSHAFLSPISPPMPCESASCLCLLDADWCLQSDMMTNSRLQACSAAPMHGRC